MTIKELAEIAGVSPATVSLVLNGKKGVSEEKRKEIIRLAEENNYLHQRKDASETKRVLFIKYSKHGKLVEENTGFISGIMDGAELECQRRNLAFSITVCEGNLAETLQGLNYSSLHGIIMLGTELDEEDYPALKFIQAPYVVVDNGMPYFDCNSVSINNVESVYKIVKYYATHGYDKISYFKSNYKVQNLCERQQGFEEGCRRYGYPFEKSQMFEVPPTMLGAFEQTQKYVEEGYHFSGGIFVDNDTMAIGVMKALMIAGYEIPGDISVIGFDNIPFAEIYSPTISTVNIDRRLLGKLSIRALEDTIKHSDYRNVKVKVTGSLTIRQSTR